MKLLGDWNWYLPRWLDRRLPRMNFEPSEAKSIGPPAPATSLTEAP
jgi:RND superfamily putative drug exporter